MPATITTPLAILENPGSITVIVGRNGSGKSRFLRDLTFEFQNNLDYYVSYVSPERGGSFSREAGIDQAISTDPNWMPQSRNKNQAGEFKTSSASLLMQLENALGRKLDIDLVLRADISKTFQSEYIDKLNALLLNIRLVRKPNQYGYVFENLEGQEVSAKEISSGESESLALGSEIFHFFLKLDFNKLCEVQER